MDPNEASGRCDKLGISRRRSAATQRNGAVALEFAIRQSALARRQHCSVKVSDHAKGAPRGAGRTTLRLGALAVSGVPLSEQARQGSSYCGAVERKRLADQAFERKACGSAG